MGSKHVLVLIHGITPEEQPDVRAQYRELVRAVTEARLPFLSPICEVEWGVPPSAADGRNGPASWEVPTNPDVWRPDQYLASAQRFVASLVRDGSAAREEDREGEPVPGRGAVDWGVPGVRMAVRKLRESVILLGLSDAIYYAAPEGERAVRDAVFSQVFAELQAADDDVVHLHVVGHSLGVTVAHDFLFSLFSDVGRERSQHRADVSQDAGTNTLIQTLQDKWRKRAREKRLVLGTFISFASQLPLLVMRKQALVESLARAQRLDPRVIGIDRDRKTVQWVNFYDSDDVLGFATRALYQPTPAIADVQMNSGTLPVEAHVGYWSRDKIVRRCVEILRQNTGRA
jgi:hypothetical protein